MSEHYGNGELADVLETAIMAAQQGAGIDSIDLIAARGALAQLRSDRRALQAKARLRGQLRNQPWQYSSDAEAAINDAFIILNWGEKPDWLDAYSPPR